MNPINIPCSVHFDMTVAQYADPLQPEHPDIVFRELKASRGFWRNCTNTINADPFLFEHNGKIFLFYEEMGKIYTPGKIKMTCSNDLEHWSEPLEVLTEPKHFSYPFVFRAEGKVWMMPECWKSGGILLYSADDDSLQHWKFEKVLIRGERLVDSSVYFKEGVYYLHSCSIEKDKSRLLLFTAEHPTGPWKEHPCSPVAEGRNGGSLLELNGKLYRFSQRNDVFYGDGLDLYEITELSPVSYQEKLVQKHFIDDGHHCNMITFRGKNIVARDHAFLSCMLPEFCRRIVHCLLNFF